MAARLFCEKSHRPRRRQLKRPFSWVRLTDRSRSLPQLRAPALPRALYLGYLTGAAMASSAISEDFEALLLEDIFARFKDIAGRMPGVGQDDVSLTKDADQVGLEVEVSGEGRVQIVAALKGENGGEEGRAGQLQLGIERNGTTRPLVTVARFNGDCGDADAWFEMRFHSDAGRHARGLDGRYSRDDVLKALSIVIETEVGLSARRPSRALTRLESPGREVVVAARTRDVAVGDAAGTQFPAAGRASAGRKATPSTRSRAAVADAEARIIAEIFEQMRGQLVTAEARLCGAGLISALKNAYTETLLAAGIVTAFIVDVATNDASVATILPGGASWAYALVGPVVLTGMGVIAEGIVKKTVAVVLMGSWAVGVGLVAGSNESYLDVAQRLFPRGEIARTHEQSLARARVDLAVSEKEVTLRTPREVKAPPAIAIPRGRWAAGAAKDVAQISTDAAAVQRREAAAALAKAQQGEKEAAERVALEELAFRQAVLEDPSREKARVLLSAIIIFINFAGPLGASWVLGRWMAEAAGVRAKAEQDHRTRTEARDLRRNWEVMRARATQLLGAAKEKARNDGVPMEVLDEVDGAKLAEKTARRFQTSVKRSLFRRLGLSRS
jgi:hypothetical protein